MGKYLAGTKVVTAEGKRKRKKPSMLIKDAERSGAFLSSAENCLWKKKPKRENTSLNVLEPCVAFDLQLNKCKRFPLCVIDVRWKGYSEHTASSCYLALVYTCPVWQWACSKYWYQTGFASPLAIGNKIQKREWQSTLYIWVHLMSLMFRNQYIARCGWKRILCPGNTLVVICTKILLGLSGLMPSMCPAV